MTGQAFLAIITFCLAGVPDAQLTNGQCQVIKYEPKDGISQRACLRRLDATAERIIAFRALDGVHLRVFARHCYSLGELEK